MKFFKKLLIRLFIFILFILLVLGIIGYIYYSKTDPEVGKRLFPLLLISIGFGLIGFIENYKKKETLLFPINQEFS